MARVTEVSTLRKHCFEPVNVRTITRTRAAKDLRLRVMRFFGVFAPQDDVMGVCGFPGVRKKKPRAEARGCTDC